MTAPTRLEGAAEPDALALSLRRDHDVLDAFGRTIELSFAASRLENPLRLTARVEGPVVDGSPFVFPPQNQFQELTAGSAFYRFTPTPAGRAPAYTFAISFAELGIRSPSEAGELKLAFSAYGTAAISCLSPLFHDLGTVLVGSATPAATFTIFNGTAQDMVLGMQWYTRAGPNSAVFPIAPGTCSDGLTIPAGGGCSFDVGFAPASSGAALDDIVVSAAFGTTPAVQETLRVQGNGLVQGIPALGVLGGLALALVLGGAGTWLLRRG